MLYRNFQIKIWKTAWIGKTINGYNYSINGDYWYFIYPDIIKQYEYVALIAECNPYRSVGGVGGSTPLIALDLAKFKVGLIEQGRQRIAKAGRIGDIDTKCLEKSSRKQSKNI
jgi:hypothetical protein